MMKNFCPFLLSLFFSANLFAGNPSFNHDRKPGFRENKGQVKNQNKETNEKVKFIFDTRQGMNVQLRKNGLSYDTYRKTNEGIKVHRLDFQLLGANPATSPTPVMALPGNSNHYENGKPLAKNVKTYETVRYNDIYEGVDFVVSATNQGQVKYDFEIEHARQAQQIVLKYKGFDSFKIENNELVFNLSGLELRETIPASWTTQDKQPIDVHYKLISQTNSEVCIGVEIADDLNEESGIVIDPTAVLEWGTYYGGALPDIGNSIATDSLGNIFATGTTSSLNNFASEGSYQSVFAGGNTDAYLVKFNQHGLRHWATYYGGSGDEEGLYVDVDAYENVYIVGKTTSTDSIGSEGAHQVMSGGGEDGFVARFDRDGELIWDSYIGGLGNETATSCHADGLGNVAVVGHTNAGGFLQNDSIIPQSVYQGGIDGFLAWYNSDGALTQSRFIGGPTDDILTGIEIDSLRNVILIGNTQSSSNIATGAAYQSTLGGGQDAFILKIDTTQSVAWATYFGGENLETATGIESVGDTLFISGNINSEIAYTDTLGNQTVLGGNMDGFVLSLLSDGSLNWFTYLGGELDDSANDISRDYAGMVYIIGTSATEAPLASDSTMGTENAHHKYNMGEEDAFVAKFSKTGIKQWSTYHGGTEIDQGNGIAVYGFTSVYIIGMTTSLDYIEKTGPEESAHQSMISSDMEDAFLARFTQEICTPPIDVGPSAGNGGGGGGSGGSGGNNGGNEGPPPIGICYGDSMQLFVNGGALGINSQWVWYVDQCGGTDNYIGEGHSIWVSPDSTTHYFVRFENVDMQGSCFGVTVHVDYPNTVIAENPEPVCPGATAELFAEGGYSYIWTGPNDFTYFDQTAILDTVSMDDAGMYQVIAYTQFGCSDTTEVELSLLPSPIFTSQTVTPTCYGEQTGSIQLNAESDSIVYFWPILGTDTSYVANLGAGTYWVTATNEFGCSQTDSIVVDERQPLIKSLEFEPAYCDQANGHASVEIVSQTDYTVHWQPINAFGNDVSNLPPGTYTVWVNNNLGCEESVTFTIQNIDDFTAIIVPDSLFLDWWSTAEVTAYALPDSLDNTFQWWPESGVSCITCANVILDPDTSTTYFVEITSAQGCTSTDSVHVHRELPIPTAFVPTVFSPNNDGLNDMLCVEGTRMISFELKIYSRYGAEVFSTNDTEKCWDGMVNGVPQTGSFVFTIDAILEDEMTHRETGNITIVR